MEDDDDIKIDVAAIQQEMREAGEAFRKKYKERPDPPDLPTSTCRVCGGIVKGEHVYEATCDDRFIPIGPGSRDCYAWRFKGYNCVDCGLVYKFVQTL